MQNANALASPADLKAVLSAVAAARALAEGFARAGVRADELPVADGGDGTLEVLASALGGEWRTTTVSDPLGRPVSARWLGLADGTAVVEAAEAIGLARLTPDERDPLRATSRGLGELILAALSERPASLFVGLGGTATVDGGAGLREVIGALPVPTEALCDVRNPLLGERGAARAFGPQKGAEPAAVEQLESRLAGMAVLRPHADRPGAGSAGGLGAAFAALGARLVPGAERILDLIGFRERARRAALVITGEGTVDRGTWEGKAPGEVVRVCREEGVDCVLFGGVVAERPEGLAVRELSGRRDRARADLVALGQALAVELVASP